ncbi:MAG TPA: tetratricopeptide repeat protein [Archangium sp.]|nr:tetratricopeptide repeat protein [Archangium sp.]
MTTPRYEQLLRAGRLEQARTEAEEALRRNPSDRGALLALAKLAAFDGEEAKVETLLARASLGVAEDPDARLVRAALLTRRGETRAALELYRELTQVQPPRGEAFFGLGFLLAAAGDYPAARDALERAVQLEPDVASHHLHLARVLFALQERKGGFQHLEKSLRLNPRHAPTYLAWAVALRSVGQLEAAEAILRQGLKLLPNDALLLQGLCDVLEAGGRRSEAGVVAETLARQHPTNPDAVGNLARFLLAENRFAQALKLCRMLSSLGKATALSASVEAQALESMEPPDLQGAIDAWRLAMKLDPRHWSAPNNLGNLLLRVSEALVPDASTQAREVLEEARRRAPHQPEPMLNLSLLYARLGEEDKARALLRELVALGPGLDPGLRTDAEELLEQLDGATRPD